MRLPNPAMVAAVFTIAALLILGQRVGDAAGQVRYVATLGEDAGNSCLDSAAPCATIQKAVTVANSGDEIRVAAGDYLSVTTRLGLRQHVAIDKSVSVRGGYTTTNWAVSDPETRPTVINALGGGRGIAISAGSPITVALDGLRIRNGSAYGQGGSLDGQDAGGGIYALTATVTLNNIMIENGIAANGGGLYAFGSAVAMTASTFLSNAAGYGGGLYLARSSGTSRANSIQQNVGTDGGGIFVDSSILTSTIDTIVGNRAENGGGIYLYGGDTRLRFATVSENLAAYGGGIYANGGRAAVDDSTIAANRVDNQGAGVYLKASDAFTVTASILRGNVVSGTNGYAEGGGLYASQSSPVIVNSVLTGNQAQYGSALHLNGPTTQTASLHHLSVISNPGQSALAIQAAAAVTNLLVADQPLALAVVTGPVTVNGVAWFTTAITATGPVSVSSQVTGTAAFAADGIHLASGSAAIDRGSGDMATDLDGQARASSPDLGADEYAPPVAGITVAAPVSTVAGSPVAIIVSASPITIQPPLRVYWQASGQPDDVHLATASDSQSYSWQTPGTRTITVTASSGGTVVSATIQITVTPAMTATLPSCPVAACLVVPAAVHARPRA